MANADRLIELFNEALAKPAGADRERFLVEHCGTDADLREQVVSLLEAAILEHESGFLRQSPLIGHRPQGAERPGDRIGPYTLIEPLGEGGCGVVYLAGQETPLRRQVALKV
ncbi:MAG TPA: serine/threonine protein kinase, partial [Verrucomicrobiales bacterium]|nr:serine/threonine protein kinase [Verrucomicrobiales bacterium]